MWSGAGQAAAGRDGSGTLGRLCAYLPTSATTFFAKDDNLVASILP